MPRTKETIYDDDVSRLAAEDSLRQAGRHLVKWLEQDVSRLDDLTALERAAMDLISPALFRRFEARLKQQEHQANDAARAKSRRNARQYPVHSAYNSDI